MLERLANHSFFCYLEWRKKDYHSAKLYKKKNQKVAQQVNQDQEIQAGR
jgi:hypothetical protein